MGGLYLAYHPEVLFGVIATKANSSRCRLSRFSAEHES
jgi:hypothetical protein